MNALTHGMWATSPLAIARGNFAENEEVVECRVAEIVDALKPQDALQKEQAFNIATLYLRLWRLRRFEAEALSGVGRPRRGPRVADAAWLLDRSCAHAVADWVIGVRDDDALDFDQIVQMLICELPLPVEDLSRILAGEPDRDQQGFKRIATAMVAEKYPEEGDAVLWAVGVAARWEDALDDAIAMREQAAREAIRDELDSAARVHARVNRELQRALGDYAGMRTGKLG